MGVQYPQERTDPHATLRGVPGDRHPYRDT